jgi:hypothetical protein
VNGLDQSVVRSAGSAMAKEQLEYAQVVGSTGMSRRPLGKS